MNIRRSTTVSLVVVAWLASVGPAAAQDALDSPAALTAAAMVETILAGDDGQPVWDALASALDDRPIASEVEAAPERPWWSLDVAGDLISRVRTLPMTVETLTIVGVLALFSVAILAGLLGSLRRARPAVVGAGRAIRRFRIGDGRARIGPICRDASRLEARLRARRTT